MWKSARLLLKGVLGHWVQSLGGTGMAIVALVADIQRWTIPARIWLTLSASLFLWAILQTFHSVRAARDDANDRLRDKTNHQALADALTLKHHEGTHELLNRVALNGTKPSDEWVRSVLQWYESVLAVMKEHGCTSQEFNHVVTINQVDMDQYRYLRDISMLIIRLYRVADVATRHAQEARRESRT